MNRTRTAVVTDADIAAALPDWTLVDESGDEPLDVLIAVAGPISTADADWPAAAMRAVGDLIDHAVHAEYRLRAGGLAILVVDDPPERARSDRAGGGVVAAALATAVRLLATDWARSGDARCLLVVRAGASAAEVAALAQWLTAAGAPPLTGQVIDMAAVAHATLLPPS